MTPPPTGYNGHNTTLVQQLLTLLPTLTIPPTGHPGNNKKPLTKVFFSFNDFSQSAACIPTRLRECSSTLLEKLQYLYSFL